MKHPFKHGTWQRLAVAAGTLAASASALAGGGPNPSAGGTVPEPGSLSLIAAGVAAALVGRHLRRRK